MKSKRSSIPLLWRFLCKQDKRQDRTTFTGEVVVKKVSHHTWWKTPGCEFLAEITKDLEANSNGHGNRMLLMRVMIMMLMRMTMAGTDTGF